MSQDYKVDLHLNTAPARKAIDALNAKIAKLQKAALGDLGTASGKKSMDQTSKAANKLSNELAQLKRDMKVLGKIPIAGNTSRQLNQIDASASRLNATLLKLRLNGQISEKTYTRMADSLQKTSTQLRRVKQDADFGYSSLRKFWERFGKVALGFSVMYTGIQLVTAGFQQFTRVIKEGIQQAGELVALQAKLAMWASMASDGALSYSDAFKQARVNAEALADASVTAISSLSELSVGMDEVGQSSVIIGKELTPQFASLVDFTILISKTTDSALKQVRQELQALMQGQVRATNILIRTAVHMNMISDDQLKALRKQEGRLEVIKSIMNSIHDVWQNVKKELVAADVNTGLKMWYDTLVRIVSKSEELASKEAGKTSIFGATAYKHFDKLQQRLDKMANTLSGEFNGALRAINAGFDGVLTIIEESIFGILNMIDKLYEMRGILVSISKIGTGALFAKGAASLLGLSGPIGWITAGVLALDQAIKHIAGMDDSVLTHVFKQVIKFAADALKETEYFFRGYATFIGKLTSEGVLNVGKIEDVNNAIRETKATLALLKDEVNALAEASWLPDVIREFITEKKLQKIERLEDALEAFRKRLYALQNPIDKTAEGLRTFVLEAKELNKVMKELNFDPLREFESAVKSGNVGMAKRIAEIIKAETMADITAVQERIAVFQKDLAKDPNNKNVSTAVTALEVELGKLEARYERVSNAVNLANEALIEQVDPLTALWEENTRLGKALEGKELEYEKELKIQQTIDALREKMGKRYHEGIAQQVRDVVEMIYHKKEELALMKDKDDATKKTTENIKDQVRIVQARLAAMREERKLALDNWKESNKFRQEGLDREREAHDEMRQVFYEYYTTETEREYNEFLKRASHYEAYIEGNKELTKEYYQWRADMQERFNRPWLAGLKDGLKDAAETMGWTYDNVSKSVQDAFSNMTDALTDFCMTGKMKFSDFAESVIRDMVKMQTQASVTKPLMGLVSTAITSFFTPNPANVSPAGWNPQFSGVPKAGIDFANGGVFQSPSLHEYANTVQTSPKLFTFAQGGVFAEAGPEAVMPLTRGANGRLGVQAEGSETKIELNIINESGQPVEAKERSRRTDMGKTIMDIVLTRVSNNTGGAKNAFKAALSG